MLRQSQERGGWIMKYGKSECKRVLLVAAVFFAVLFGSWAIHLLFGGGAQALSPDAFTAVFRVAV